MKFVHSSVISEHAEFILNLLNVVATKHFFIFSYETVKWHNHLRVVWVYALMPLLSTHLAPDNCRQIHMWRVRGIPLGSPPEGR